MNGTSVAIPNSPEVWPRPAAVVPAAGWRAFAESLEVETKGRLEFVDLTPALRDALRRSEVATGMAVVHTRHTTTAVIVNEQEPLLLSDMKRLLERLVPADAAYAHNDLLRRQAPPDEPENAAAHLRALLLPASQALVVSGGALQLGRWQSVLLLELDGPRRREVAISVVGAPS
jgi:secondary thiamine-phosphate synthase enzyme